MSVAMESQAEVALPSRERIELILSHLDRLPTLPPVAARVLALATSDQSSARDLVEVIELDPALTAGILRLVRRADLGVRQKDMTVARAVTLMGFHAVRNAVLCSEFFECLPDREADGSSELRKQLWVHSIGVACAAEWIAERLGRLDLCGDAFVCGLLHDIGKIALQSCLPKSYQRIADRVLARPMSICDAEQQLLGLDHTIAGKRLVCRWGLPPVVVEVVWLHHQDVTSLPSFVTAPDMVRIVRLADETVRSLHIGFSGSQPVDASSRTLESVGLSSDVPQELAKELPLRMTGLLEAMGLEGVTEIDVARSLEIAHQQLRRICADLTEKNRALVDRGRLFDAVGRFTAGLLNTRSLADVCALAAASIRDTLPVSAVCVYAVDREHRMGYVGWCEHGGAASSDAFDAEDLGLPRDTEGPRTNVVPGPAGPAHTTIWQRSFAAPPPAPLLAVPLMSDRIEAGILIANDSRSSAGVPQLPEPWGVLACSVGSAIALALSRNEAERAAEESLDLNRRLKEAQTNLLRMRSIGMVAEMAAGAAHELNNPLAVISGRAQMELGAATDPERQKSMEVIVAQTRKAAQIVLDLMSFAKPDPPTPIVQPLSAVLNAVCQHWHGQVRPDGPRLTVSISDYDAIVYADSAQIIQALNEIVANALQAADSASGRVSINSNSRASDEAVRIVIEDNGVGMSPEVLEHAIDPFFSSRPAGRGRGLGLSKAYRLVEINGGQLWLESQPNVRTAVTLELPSRALDSMK